MFQCVVHHSGKFAMEFANFTESRYQGLETIWNVDPDYWSYFEILGMLKDLGYLIVDKLWYYDEMNACDIVLLEDNKGTKRMQTIAIMTGECHLYVTHLVSQPDITDEPILSLELDDEVVMDVGDEFGVNETDVGTTVVQDIINMALGFRVNETDVGTIRRACEYDYKVRHISLNGEKYAINPSKKECSYRMWMPTGLPCCHVISCMKDQHLQIDDFKKDLNEACYSPVIYPVNGEALWTKYDVVDLQPPPIKR
ncbi:hypothetical protein KIW84_075030 [Lathyrus oleraceus]|uniref:PB1-like domain-containing protein n=1 Tax=Pisum sativum TaxID=3888 RepID=A0A9D4VVF1_PEA|nr:hypothetical protein KIW84_075030 [Pisum sativum]